MSNAIEDAAKPTKVAGKSWFHEMWDLRYVIDQHRDGDYDFCTVIGDDYELPHEVPSSYRYNTAEIVREYFRQRIYEAVKQVICGRLAMDELLASGSLLGAYRRYVTMEREYGREAPTYAYFLYRTLIGSPLTVDEGPTHQAEDIAEHMADVIVDALAKSNLEGLAKLKVETGRAPYSKANDKP